MRRYAALLTLALAAHHAAAAPNVVTTLKPLHSLVSQIMDGVGEPVLLINQGSPHGYQSKPSDARAIASADLVVWVSSDLETFIPALLDKSGTKHRLEWRALPGLHKLKTRSGGLWEEHAHEHHDHDHDHAGHDHAHDHKHDHDHHHGEYNDHLWLGTDAAKTLLNAVAHELGDIDPDNKATYDHNLQQSLAALDALDQRIAATLAPVKNRPYMVFHDAYPYFEHQYGLQPVGVVRVDPEHEPGSKRIAELHSLLREHKIVCLFNEPQYPAKLTAKLVADTKVRSGTLDPLGAELAPGKTLHGQLLENLANSLQQCLQDSGS
ncbi:MAG: zinc ABC transporter substrate-binding protein ZnuA [Cardiobacteriaceae bacterium]|nr:zinc ABC transporter substrate-binding protein ZnuA [Cardiobacteriaceae bacterium]